MPRSAEFPIPEHFSNAARNDLPRAVLSYADNLVLQAKEILDRHGVTIGDLKKPEARERIPAEDMRRLLDLSAKNAAARRGEVDAAARREITVSLDARQDLAESTLGSAEEILFGKIGGAEQLAGWYVRAGKTIEADAMITTWVNDAQTKLRLMAPVHAAFGFEAVGRNAQEARRQFEIAVKKERTVAFPKDDLHFETYFLALLRSLSDDEFFDAVAHHVDAEGTRYPKYDVRRPFIVRSVRYEAGRRGLKVPDAVESADDGTKLISTLELNDRIGALLSVARAEFAFGRNPEDAIRRALALSMKKHNPSRRASLVSKVFRTAAFTLDDKSLDRYFHAETDRASAFLGSVDGLVLAKKYDRAVELVIAYESGKDQKDGQLRFVTARMIRGLCDRDEIARVEALYARDWADPGTRSYVRMHTELEYLQARARRGDDVLGELVARRSASGLPAGSTAEVYESASWLAAVSIATLGYLRPAMYEMEEYDPKR